MPLVSVIIPTHNRAWCLEQAVQSVLNQDFQDFELIVVDDGSQDNTGELLSKYRGVVAINQEQHGVSAARNTGVRHSSGEFIAFLDSDDQWAPAKLAVQVDYFKNHPQALICQTGEIWIRKGKRVNPKVKHEKPSGEVFERSLELCLVSPSAVMMRRALFKEMGGFDESLPACEDYDLWLRIGCRYPVTLLDEPLVIKNGGHDDQLSAAPGLDQFRIASLANLLDNAPLTRKQRQAAVRVLDKKCRIYANGCSKRGKKDEAGFYRILADHYTQETCLDS